jgi:hypothetical protein
MSEYLNWRYATQKFDPARKISEAEFLELLESVVLCPVGYRAKDDQYTGLKKVRFTKSEVFIER